MFRVKIRVPEEMVESHIDVVKTGVRGVGYVKLDEFRRMASFAAGVQKPAGSCAAKEEESARPKTPASCEIKAARRRRAECMDASTSMSSTAARPSPRRSCRSKTSLIAMAQTLALDGLSLDIPSGRMVGVIGPDGVGKSTLLALIAGSKKIQQGKVIVLGWRYGRCTPPARRLPAHRLYAAGPRQESLFRAQRRENIDFMARLFGLSAAERPARIKELLDATGLGPFPGRPAGKLSGGMKQKVSLCGALVHEPDLLILDEPTTGVDPLSRRQFWSLIDDIRAVRPSMSVMISTAYMDEAAALGLDRRHGRRARARDRHAERADGADGNERPREVLRPPAARGKAQRPRRSDHSAAPGGQGRNRHRRQGTDAPLRRFRRGRPCDLDDRARRNLRLPRLQRLRQVDDDEDAHRPAAAHRRKRDAVRPLGRSGQHRGAQNHRLYDAGLLAL